VDRGLKIQVLGGWFNTRHSARRATVGPPAVRDRGEVGARTHGHGPHKNQLTGRRALSMEILQTHAGPYRWRWTRALVLQAADACRPPVSLIPVLAAVRSSRPKARAWIPIPPRSTVHGTVARARRDQGGSLLGFPRLGADDRTGRFHELGSGARQAFARRTPGRSSGKSKMHLRVPLRQYQCV
jgi:hypothetical protein